jgi:hypothetical protein
MPAAIRRIHSKYLGEKTFPKEITEFEIREFFTLSPEDHRAIRVDSNKKSRQISDHHLDPVGAPAFV